MTRVDEYKLMGKYMIKTDIKLLTALHIGGTEEGFEIGGIDNSVIKDKMTGVPYIPGSSLKGKMRSLLEWIEDQVHIELKNGLWEGKSRQDIDHRISIVFGLAAEKHVDKEDYKNGAQPPGPTRLTVMDSYPDKKQIDEWEKYMGEKIYTEVKTENAIDRLTSAANPRNMERVPAESVFKGEFIYDVYCPEDIERLKVLIKGMMLLEDSTLGGGGSRGSGRIKFQNISIEVKNRNYYTTGKEEILQLNYTNAKEIGGNITEFMEKSKKYFKVEG